MVRRNMLVARPPPPEFRGDNNFGCNYEPFSCSEKTTTEHKERLEDEQTFKTKRKRKKTKENTVDVGKGRGGSLKRKRKPKKSESRCTKRVGTNSSTTKEGDDNIQQNEELLHGDKTEDSNQASGCTQRPEVDSSTTKEGDDNVQQNDEFLIEGDTEESDQASGCTQRQEVDSSTTKEGDSLVQQNGVNAIEDNTENSNQEGTSTKEDEEQITDASDSTFVTESDEEPDDSNSEDEDSLHKWKIDQKQIKELKRDTEGWIENIGTTPVRRTKKWNYLETKDGSEWERFMEKKYYERKPKPKKKKKLEEGGTQEPTPAAIPESKEKKQKRKENRRKQRRLMREVRSQTKNVVPWYRFCLTVKDICEELRKENKKETKYRWKPDALKALRCGVEAELSDIFEKMMMVAENDNRVVVTPGDMRLILAIERKDYISRYVMERLKKKECKMHETIGYNTDDEQDKSGNKKTTKSGKQNKETAESNDESDGESDDE